MADDACCKTLEDGGRRVEQQPLSFIAEHSDIVEDGSEEDSECEDDFDDVFHVAEEEACGGNQHGDAGRENHHHEDEQRNPDELRAPADLNYCEEKNQSHG